MMRKIISALLALLLCCSFAVSVSAADTEFVIDEFGYLVQEEVDSLNALATAIYEETGVGIFYAYVSSDSAEHYDVSPIVGDATDYVVMVETKDYWFVHKGGRGEIITYDDEDTLRAIYDETATYPEGVMAFLEAAAEYFPAESVTEPVIQDEDVCFLYDDADLLTDGEEATLAAKLEEISYARNTQLVICTIASMDGGDVDEFLPFWYDSMGFGFGENNEGVLLLICMDPREYRILSNGYAGEAIGPDQIDTLCDFMDTYLPNGHYVAAFNSFADQCGEMLEYYQAGSPFKIGKNLAISLVIGILVGVIVAFVLRGQLKSVRKKELAHAYVREDSMHLDYKYDIFLYRNVSRTEKQKREESTSSGSGGSTRSKGGGTF